jgi:PAS domain S-box-containing protein
MNKSANDIGVLYVDDDPAATESVSEALAEKDEQTRVRTETTVAGGWEVLTSEPIDCIVAAYTIPDGSGLEFLRSVRESEGDLPFILYTDTGSETVASEAISAGVTDYIQKGSERATAVASRVMTAIRSRREEQRQHRQLNAIESAREGISILDENGQFVYVNEAYADLYGYDPEEMIGEHWELVYPDENVSRIYEGVLSTVAEKGYWEGTTTGLRADGETFTEDHVLARTDQGGLVCTVRDVTERNEREAELERTRDLLKQTERIADVGGWEINTETMELFWTEHLFEIMGIEAAEEPSLSEAIEIYHEADRELVREAVDRALEDGEAFDVEVRFERSEGQIRWLQVRGSPTVEDGDVVTLRGAIKDITERRRREQILREMYEIISDPEQSFEERVKSLLELGRSELGTRYGTLSQINGEEYLFDIVAGADELVAPGDQVPVEATNCERVAETRQTVVLGDIERDAPGETDRAGYTEMGICSYIGAPVYVEDEVRGTFCFYDTEPRDGEFSEWEQTLVDLMSRWASHGLQRRQATEQLQAKNEQLEQFASIVSHDLRNPLNVASLRLEQAMDETGNEHLEEVEQAHDRMERLIEDLLELALEGETVNETEAVELEEIVEHCRQTVDTQDGAVEVVTDEAVEADRSRLQQLGENLVRNAFDHCGEDVQITVGRIAEGFYVEDDGPGIPDEDRAEVFDPGFSTSEDGTGFGLSIVKQVADAHDWDIEVTEGSDGGARFEVTGVEFVDG